jgi:hypothetical protein
MLDETVLSAMKFASNIGMSISVMYVIVYVLLHGIYDTGTSVKIQYLYLHLFLLKIILLPH